VIHQGDVVWVELPPSFDSSPGFRRPAVIVQGERFNMSRITTAVCVLLTSNLSRADAPGNVLLRMEETSLPKDSVATVSQLLTVDRSRLSPPIGRVPTAALQEILSGIDLVLGR
jgi:mRNA interferase MazF